MILCCGEALIDMLPRTTVAGEPAYAPYSGGAVFNTAIALGRLGAPTGFLSGLSTDLFGQQLSADLDASGVDSSFAVRSGRHTTLAFVKLTDGKAEYAFFDEETAGRMLRPEDLPAIPDRVTTLLFGCISLIPEPCGATYEGLMARMAPSRVIFFDPNLRPGFIPDRGAHLARMRRMLAMSDIVKVSDEDLAWFGEGDFDEVAPRWRALGPKIVVMTRGGDGAVALGPHGRVEVPAVSVKVADTVGAGDTFNAGMLDSLNAEGLLDKAALAAISSGELAEALARAVRAAAICVSRPGANPPWAHEM
ncbi:MAG: carbohydrate kinase [Phyllobacteriaceae bacterium]|nr:carbohydrate kinase [Phyllobacteriaceae bacterium]